MNSLPGSLAFDFDGILCNGLREYFQTAWRVYCDIWGELNAQPPEGLAERFYKLRPVVEVGWEMPVVLRATMTGFSDDEVLADWHRVRQALVSGEKLDTPLIARKVDHTRDQWIQHELEAWLDLHSFYPGVLEMLRSLQAKQIPFVIVTTKESRFVKRLLARANIQLNDDQIFGKDCKRPKPETLRILKSSLPQPIWFVEDRIAALRAVQAQPDLQDIGLFLGDWGYNIERDRQEAESDPILHRLSLEKFAQPLESWI